MLGNSTYLDVGSNEACNICVIVAVSKAHSSGETSIIYCLKLNAVGEVIEGHPFRLSKPSFRYIWENDEVSTEKIQFVSVVKYVEIGQEYLYMGNTKRPRMVGSIFYFPSLLEEVALQHAYISYQFFMPAKQLFHVSKLFLL